MQFIHLLTIIRQVGIEETTIFYGMEEIVTNNSSGRCMRLLNVSHRHLFRHYRLPPGTVHGVVTRLEM